jgi:hypothetical protein
MAMTRAFAGTLLVAALASHLAGCAGPCNLVAYPSGAVLHLDSGAAIGMYRVEVDIGTETLLVAYTTSSDGQAFCVSACEDTQGAFRLGSVFGAASAPAEDVALNVRRTDEATGPARFQLYRDDILVTDEEIRPRYETTEPRGDGCGENTLAQIDIVVP